MFADVLDEAASAADLFVNFPAVAHHAVRVAHVRVRRLKTWRDPHLRLLPDEVADARGRKDGAKTICDPLGALRGDVHAHRVFGVADAKRVARDEHGRMVSSVFRVEFAPDDRDTEALSYGA